MERILAARRASYNGLIDRGSPWEHGFFESFNARLRDEPLTREITDACRASSQGVVAIYHIDGLTWRNKDEPKSSYARSGLGLSAIGLLTKRGSDEI